MMFESFLLLYCYQIFEVTINFLKISDKWYTINTIQISYETAVLKDTSSTLDNPDSQLKDFVFPYNMN